MSTKSKLAAALASAGILAAGWSAGTVDGATLAIGPTSTTDTPSTTASASGTTTGSTAGTTTATRAGTATTASAKSTTVNAGGAYKDGTYTGTTVSHRYGSVTVTVTVAGGRIGNVTASVVDDGDRKSQRINSSAIPTIKSNVLAANSASVSTISGATYTTRAYLTSLQAALAKAA